jgi:hypothetical protein
VKPQPTARRPHGGQAGHRLPWRSICTQAGLFYRPRSLYTITPGAAERTTRKPFFLNPAVGFCLLRAGCSFPASMAAVSAATAETASEDRPLTLPPLWSALGGGGGALWRVWLPPWTQLVPEGWCAAPRSVDRAICTVNSPACIYNATYSVIN